VASPILYKQCRYVLDMAGGWIRKSPLMSALRGILLYMIKIYIEYVSNHQ
jgi:hypothetical protein